MLFNFLSALPKIKLFAISFISLCISVISLPIPAASFTLELGPDDKFSVKGSDGNSKFAVDNTGVIYPAEGEDSHLIKIIATIDPTENGTRLLDAVQSLGYNYGEIPYVIQLDPGEYDLGSERLFLPRWVSLVGAGQRTTIIRGHGGTTQSEAFTVLVRRNSDIRNLTIESTGDAPYLVALTSWASDGYFVSVTDVILAAEGGSTETIALHMNDGYDVRFNRVVAIATDPGGMSESTSYTGCSFENFDSLNFMGIAVDGLECRAHGQKGENIGLLIQKVGQATFRAVKARASGATRNIGFAAIDSSADFFGSTFHASRGENEDLSASISQADTGAQRIRFFGSVLGPGSAFLKSDGKSAVQIANSQIAGGTNQAVNMQCVAVHDENLNFYADSCPPQ